MTDYDISKFYAGLVEHGHIVPTGVAGAFGRGAVFEDVLERFNGLVTNISRNDGAEVFTFPPVINRQILEKVHYLDSFPHLCGAVYSFFGKDQQAAKLSEKVNSGEPWGDMLGMTDVVMNPAAFPLIRVARPSTLCGVPFSDSDNVLLSADIVFKLLL